MRHVCVYTQKTLNDRLSEVGCCVTPAQSFIWLWKSKICPGESLLPMVVKMASHSSSHTTKFHEGRILNWRGRGCLGLPIYRGQMGLSDTGNSLPYQTVNTKQWRERQWTLIIYCTYSNFTATARAVTKCEVKFINKRQQRCYMKTSDGVPFFSQVLLEKMWKLQ